MHLDGDMSNITRSHRMLTAAILSTLISLAACGAPAPPPQVTLRIGVFPVQEVLPYFVMQEQGFAQRNGLRCEAGDDPMVCMAELKAALSAAHAPRAGGG